MKKGEYKVRKVCRLCGSKELSMFLDMGWMPHAGDFLKEKDIGTEKHYPLKVHFCNECGLVQVLHVINPDTLFKDYRYLSSVGLKDHFEKYANLMFDKFLKKGDSVVEIGSNDGVLLSPLRELGVEVLGVDPAENVSEIAKNKGLPTMVDYFDGEVAEKILKKHQAADAVFANNVLAHIDNMIEVFSGIKRLLKDEGVLVFEVHYLPDLVESLQYDFFYNEHLSYYTLHSLAPFIEEYGMEIFDVDKIDVHSGSIRVYVKKKINKKIKSESSVQKVLKFEEKEGYLDDSAMIDFGRRVKEHKTVMVNKLKEIKKEGKSIVGYGAAGRGNTLLNYCGIGEEVLEYIVDESPERYGRYTPGTHIPIVKPEVFRKNYPDYALLIAWSYSDMIIEKERAFRSKGGKFLIPLPKLKVM